MSFCRFLFYSIHTCRTDCVLNCCCFYCCLHKIIFALHILLKSNSKFPFIKFFPFFIFILKFSHTQTVLADCLLLAHTSRNGCDGNVFAFICIESAGIVIIVWRSVFVALAYVSIGKNKKRNGVGIKQNKKQNKKSESKWNKVKDILYYMESLKLSNFLNNYGRRQSVGI